LHIKLTLKPREKSYIELPIYYNYLLQGLIYKNIFPELAEFLHNEGFCFKKRRFKMFSFSRLQGVFRINAEKKTIVFEDSAELVISTPLTELSQSLGDFILKDNFRLGKEQIVIDGIEMKDCIVRDNSIILRTLSPVTAYSTATLPDGSKYTIYYNPQEKRFEEIINNNLRKKYYALNGEKAPEYSVHLKIRSKPKLNIVKFKGIIIKGYIFNMELTGPRELLQLAVDTGVGGKNSQGFGCVEMM